MKTQKDYKAKDGKLLRLDVEHEGDLIHSIIITGDFFIYPEEGILSIEKALEGKRLSEVQDVFEALLKEQDLTVIGFTASDLFEALAQAMQEPDAA